VSGQNDAAAGTSPASTTHDSPLTAHSPLRIGIVAGEVSGDNLGAGLIRAIRARRPDTEFFGIAGPRMQAEGCECWEPSDSLAVMGLFEVLTHLPRLLRLRRHGLRTVQYVSPQVWAWRQGRVERMAGFLDLVLCLLPFEQGFYDRHGLAAEFVGHPLADRIPLEADRAAARAALGLPDTGEVVAILPGSRRGEVGRLGTDFAAAAAWLTERRPGIRFIAPMANPAARALFEQALGIHAAGATVDLLDGRATEALTAADAVLVASGTATLETLLCKRPMVVAYRLGTLTAWVMRSLGLMKAPHFAQPNLLAGREVVPEIFQQDVTPARLGTELARWLDHPEATRELETLFHGIHLELRRGASERAAEAVLHLVEERDRAPR